MSTEAAVFCSRPVTGVQDAEALHLLGASLHREGRLEESAEALAKAAGLEPTNPRYRISLAATLGRLGRHHEAIGELVFALTLRGDIPELHNNLGMSLKELGRLKEAATAFRNALTLRSDFLQARRNLGNVLRALGRLKEARSEYETAIALEPDDAESLGGLSFIATETGDAHLAVALGRRQIELMPNSASSRSSVLYTMHYCHDVDANTLWREHREWGRIFCDPVRHKTARHANDPLADRRIRVGYISPDLREHTVTKFIGAAIQHHDADRFELFCYSDAEKPDYVTERLKSNVEHGSIRSSFSVLMCSVCPGGSMNRSVSR